MVRLFLALTAVLLAPASAQYKMEGKPGEAPGPWIFGTIGVGKGAGGAPLTTALKGLAIRVGANGEAAVCYDLDLCRMAGAWTGGKLTTPMNLMSRGEFPTALGDVAWTLPERPGFGITGPDQTKSNGPWKDSRPEPYGPIPEVRYRGMETRAESVVVKWEVAGREILEVPGYVAQDAEHVFVRAFRCAPSDGWTRIAICPAVGTQTGGTLPDGGKWFATDGGMTATVHTAHPGLIARVWDGLLDVLIPPSKEPQDYRILIGRQPVAGVTPGTRSPFGGPASVRWPEQVTTAGELSTDAASAYVLDTVPLPDPNPWKAPLFLAGLDFFPDGRAAVSTFHGDVFIVSGLDEKLASVQWRRFASGLYHPLGLKVVDGEVYVAGRDGITRLRDTDGNGEADAYDAFNWDIKATPNFHEFVFDLQTDPQGNFYFIKAGPVKNGGRGFDTVMEHHGAMLRVSRDGAKMERIATGFRAPNGIGVGPRGELTSGDNEGTWTPACRLNWIRPGGFYGVVDLAHRSTPPTDYDRPLCWLPKRVDNSSGGQAWVTSERWGPWKDELLHLSYGQCSLFGVLREELPGGVVQGGVVQFPGIKFQSGGMRPRFAPHDGQLYVAGLRGWQTSGLKNGSLQRVRYTGQPVRMPSELHARQDGIELRFSCTLDTQSARDPESWNVEAWDYLWSGAYGSPELSTVEPAEPGAARPAKHDVLAVKSVTIGTDDRTVFLEIPGMKPAMQMAIKYQIRASDGVDVKGEVIHTVHALGEAP